jgi:L-rhamnose isomerase
MGEDETIERAYALARERYAELGVDTERALAELDEIAVSLHCWQGDDVTGFEESGSIADAGLAVTGSYPWRARTADELRSDLEMALSLVPGRHRVNLHAIYAETGGAAVERDALEVGHFARWLDWAREHQLGLDFNPSFFAHPRAADGQTLSHPDPGTRRFWIDHGIACRRIGAAMGRALGTPCVTNVWIPDGSKDLPADRKAPRERLWQALDELFAEPLDASENLDSLESKLFGIGSEAYVVGSHEFYLGYAVRRGKMLCLDTGHFHPTEVVSDKISAVLMSLDRVLLHVSRGLRWDSDHVVVLGDELEALAVEIVRGGYLPRVHIGLDFFDASINRVAAWVIGAQSMLKALLRALLEPTDRLRAHQAKGDLTARLALLEEVKGLPAGAVWDAHCLRRGVPSGLAWLERVRTYEREVLSQRA